MLLPRMGALPSTNMAVKTARLRQTPSMCWEKIPPRQKGQLRILSIRRRCWQCRGVWTISSSATCCRTTPPGTVQSLRGLFRRHSRKIFKHWPERRFVESVHARFVRGRTRYASEQPEKRASGRDHGTLALGFAGVQLQSVRYRHLELLHLCATPATACC